jgi:predicted PurR-regulated permease PerM
MRIRKWSTTTRAAVILVLLFLTAIFLFEMGPLISSLIMAGLLAYTLNLAVRYLTRHTPLRRKWAINLLYFLLVSLIIATPGTLVPIIVNQWQTLTGQLATVSQQLQEFIKSPLVIGGLELPLEQIFADITAVSTDFSSAFEGALAVVETTSLNLIRLLIVIVTGYYLLMDWHGLRDWLVRLLPEVERDDALRVIGEIDQVWRAYLQGTLALGVIMAVFFIIVGYIIGLPGAVAVGIATGILSMIPEIGPWIAAVIAILIGYFAGSNYLPISNFWFAVLIAGIFLVVTQVKSLWLRPRVMRRFMHLNTGLVFLAIISAALLQGVLAALVVLPVLATIGVVGRYFRARLLDIDPWPQDAQIAQAVQQTQESAAPLAPTEEQDDEQTMAPAASGDQ